MIGKIRSIQGVNSYQFDSPSPRDRYAKKGRRTFGKLLDVELEKQAGARPDAYKVDLMRRPGDDVSPSRH